jgi:hypothetical protein
VNSPRRLVDYFLPLTGGLALLFAVLQPPTTQPLPFWQAWLHWWLHVSLGLALAVAAATALGRHRGAASMPLPVFLLTSGALGVVAFAPLALALESWLPQAAEADAPDRLDRWEAAGGAWAVLAEGLQLAPSYLASWFLLNAGPVLAGRAAPAYASALADEPATASAAPATGVPVETTGEPAGDRVRASPLDRLPPAIGRDLVSISADLHYLHVVTTRGRATLLGSLSHVEADLADHGVRLHRAHWVALAQVRRLVKSERGWRCELRDGRRLPVSRRRVGDVRARLGKDFVVQDSE